ncbi:MAG: tetratricopeptide repeat protein [Phycisphaerales bacterium]|nr:tetratricopeptide repeat protein [Phycisphaerales bacterium]
MASQGKRSTSVKSTRPAGAPAGKAHDKGLSGDACGTGFPAGQDGLESPSHSRPSYDKWILLGILIVALAIRGLYLGEIAAKPEFVSPGVDAGFHQYWADGLVTGNWAPPPGNPDPHTQQVPFVRPPGYPYFLAALYRVIGINIAAPRVVQMAFGLAGCLLAFVIGKRWFSSRIGLLWSAGMATCWAFVYFEGELHATTLTTIALLASVYLLGRWRDRPRLLSAAGVGVLLGIAALLRPNVLPVAAVVCVWMVLTLRKGDNRKRAWLSAAVASAVTLATIAPATIRNYRVSGEFVPISANGGVNLYIGNNPDSGGHAAGQVPGFGRFHTPYDYPAIVASVERHTGKPMSYREVSAFFNGLAFKYMRTQPGDWLRLMAKKTLMFWGPVEVPNNWEIQLEHDNSPVLSHLPGGFASVLALALVGLVAELTRTRRVSDTNLDRRALVRLAIAIVVVIFAAIVPFFVAGRYRVPLIPYLLLFAAIAIDTIITAFAARKWQTAALTTLLCVLVYLPCRVQFAGPPPSPGRWHMDRGLAYARLEEFDKALAEYAQAIAYSPQSPHLRLVTAHALRRVGRLDEAAEQLMTTLAYDNPYKAEVYVMLAQIRLEQRQPEAALSYYQSAVAADPHAPAARRELAWLLNVMGRPAEAVPHLETLLSENPNDAETELFLGLTLRDLGRAAEADAHVKNALEKRPDLRAMLSQSAP